jgi:hypothetical protein
MSDVLVTEAGSILEVLFNRPEENNALTGAMCDAIAEAFRPPSGYFGSSHAAGRGGDTFTSSYNDIRILRAGRQWMG